MNTPRLLTALLCFFFVVALMAADPAPEMPKVNYVFNAKVVRVIDAGTVALDVDLGFHMWLHNQLFVIQGVTAPSPDNQSAAMAAKARTQEVLVKEDEIVLQSIRDKNDKSGAYHAVLWKDGENLNEKIIKGGKP